MFTEVDWPLSVQTSVHHEHRLTGMFTSRHTDKGTATRTLPYVLSSQSLGEISTLKLRSLGLPSPGSIHKYKTWLDSWLLWQRAGLLSHVPRKVTTQYVWTRGDYGLLLHEPQCCSFPTPSLSWYSLCLRSDIGHRKWKCPIYARPFPQPCQQWWL